jgi:hypothetical protein
MYKIETPGSLSFNNIALKNVLYLRVWVNFARLRKKTESLAF